MSKTFLRPKVSSTKVTDWVDPSFDDFLECRDISTITATSLGVNNSSHRRKNGPSTLESSKFPTRKRGNLSSLEQIYGLENSKESLSENEPWVDKYKPETQHELAVHKKKIEEVETWLKAQVLERQPKQGGSILLITGPPGCETITTKKYYQISMVFKYKSGLIQFYQISKKMISGRYLILNQASICFPISLR